MTTMPADIRHHAAQRETNGARPTSPGALWAGRGASALAVAFLLFDTAIKLIELPVALQSTAQLGWPPNAVFRLGVVELVCLILYLLPRTAVLGAILWTGYLGGAIASHARVGDPLFSHVLFPVYVAALLWAGLWLRNARAAPSSRRCCGFRETSHGAARRCDRGPAATPTIDTQLWREE